ncbi:MAG: GTP cyclohydrolase, FolE2/MptA family [Potamolinea sp.]
MSTYLPEFNRNWPSFFEVFGVNADQVIDNMNQAGDDIPEQKPKYSISLNSVGVSRKNIPVQILDPFGSGEVVQISCSVVAETSVPVYKRGIHMSRIGDIFAQLTTKAFASLQEYSLNVAELLTELEYGGFSKVEVNGELPYLEQVAGWKPEKDKISLEHLSLTAATYTKEEKGYIQNAGLEISNITACPCVQSTYRHTLLQSNSELDKQLINPLITHSQRCRTKVEIVNIHGNIPIPIKDILNQVDQGVVRVQNTLPREYELLMVYQAHKQPQFIEDVVREIAVKVSKVTKDKFPDSLIRVTSKSMESIHDFDIQALLEDSIENFSKEFS